MANLRPGKKKIEEINQAAEVKRQETATRTGTTYTPPASSSKFVPGAKTNLADINAAAETNRKTTTYLQTGNELIDMRNALRVSEGLKPSYADEEDRENQRRIERGEEPVISDKRLAKTASERAGDMIRTQNKQLKDLDERITAARQKAESIIGDGTGSYDKAAYKKAREEYQSLLKEHGAAQRVKEYFEGEQARAGEINTYYEVIAKGDGDLFEAYRNAYYGRMGSDIAATFTNQPGGSLNPFALVSQGSANKAQLEAYNALKRKGYTDEQIAAYMNVANDKSMEPVTEWVKQYAEEHPIAAPIVTAAVKGITAPIRGAAGALAMVYDNQYRNSPLLTGNIAANEAQAAAADTIKTNLGGGFLGGAASMVYNAAISSIESVVTMTAGGPIGELFLASDAASSALNDAYKNGMDSKHALVTAIGAGVFEAVFEHLSLENLRGLKVEGGATSVKEWIVNMLKQSFTEGSEEVATDLANEMFDYLVNGGASAFERSVRENMAENGMTYAQARAAYAKEFGLQIADSFITGALAGGMGASTVQTASLANTVNTQRRVGAGVRTLAATETTAEDGTKAPMGVQKAIATLTENATGETKKALEGLTEKTGKRKTGATVLQALREESRMEQQNRANAAENLTDVQQKTIRDALAAEGIGNAERTVEAYRAFVNGTATEADIEALTAGENRSGLDVIQEILTTGDEKRRAEQTALFRMRLEGAIQSNRLTAKAIKRIEKYMSDKAVKRANAQAETIKAAKTAENTAELVETKSAAKIAGGAVQVGGFAKTSDGSLRVIIDENGATADLDEVTFDDEERASLYARIADMMRGEGEYTVKLSADGANLMLALYENAAAKGAEKWALGAYNRMTGRGQIGLRTAESFLESAYQAYAGGTILKNKKSFDSAMAYDLTEDELGALYAMGAANYNAKPGVLRLGTETLTKMQKAELKVLDAMFRRYGITLVVTDDLRDVDERMRVFRLYGEQQDDVIVVNMANGQNVLALTAYHELYHWMGKQKGDELFEKSYAVMQETIIEWVKKNADYKEIRKQIEELGYTGDLIDEEIASQFFGTVIARGGLKEFAQENKTLFEKMLDHINAFLDDVEETIGKVFSEDLRVQAALKEEADEARERAQFYMRMVDWAVQLRKEGSLRTEGSEAQSRMEDDRRGNGYDGYSMSNNARAAYEAGEMPLSKWTKAAIIEAAREIDETKADMLEAVPLRTLRDKLLYRSAWHHTSSMYNRTDFYAIDEDVLENVTQATVNEWMDIPAPQKKETAAYRGAIDYIEWTGTKKHPKANRQRLDNVTIEERGSFYIVTDEDGNEILRKKIGSNGTYVTNYDAEQRRRQAAAQEAQRYKENSTEDAYAYYMALRENGMDVSASGHMYEAGRKPTRSDYENGLENHFARGEQRLYRNTAAERYELETWDGTQWVQATEDREEIGTVTVDTAAGIAGPSQSRMTWMNSVYVKDRDYMIGRLAESIKDENGVPITKEEAARYVDSINGLAALIAGDTDLLDYEDLHPGDTAVKTNSEYGLSIDISTLCAKRLLFTGTFDEIQRLLPQHAFTGEELAELRNMMLDKKYSACGICYVESTRREMGPICEQFIERYKLARERSTDDAPAVITRLNAEGGETALRKKGAKKDLTASDEYIPTLYDLTTAIGINALRDEHPAIYDAFIAYMNARGQAKPKLLEMQTAYKHELLNQFKRQKNGRQNQKTDRFNKAGGLRLQSFSDFEIIHLIDMMQVVTDMAMVGLKGQAYTKVPAFVEAMAATGIKINMSLIAAGDGYKTVNGRQVLTFDRVEGMSELDAFDLRRRFSETAGTILVGKNDVHIRLALEHGEIDFVIPFHKSSWKEDLYEALGLRGYNDYTKHQNEIPIRQATDAEAERCRKADADRPGAGYYYATADGKQKKVYYYKYNADFEHPEKEGSYWIKETGKKIKNLQPMEYIAALCREKGITPEMLTQQEIEDYYLQLCRKDNRLPKFPQFVYAEDGVTRQKGYYKLLMDFKIFNNEGLYSPQETVKPTFFVSETEDVAAAAEALGLNIPDGMTGNEARTWLRDAGIKKMMDNYRKEAIAQNRKFEKNAVGLPVAQDIVDEWMRKHGQETAEGTLRYTAPTVGESIPSSISQSRMINGAAMDYVERLKSGSRQTWERLDLLEDLAVKTRENLSFAGPEGAWHDQKTLERIARKYMHNTTKKEYVTEFAQRLAKAEDILAANGRNTDTVLYGLYKMLYKEFEHAGHWQEPEGMYQEFRKVFRDQGKTRTIYMDPQTYREVAEHYGGYQAFRNRIMGKFFVTTDQTRGTALDTFYEHELEEGDFGIPKTDSPSEQIKNILTWWALGDRTVANDTEVYMNYGATIDEAATEQAIQMLAEILTTPIGKKGEKTFEQNLALNRIEELTGEVDEERRRGISMTITRADAEMQARLEELSRRGGDSVAAEMERERIKEDYRTKALRMDYQARVSALEYHYAEMMRIEALRRQTRQNLKAIMNRLEKGTDNVNVPEAMRKTVIDFLKLFSGDRGMLTLANVDNLMFIGKDYSSEKSQADAEKLSNDENYAFMLRFDDSIREEIENLSKKISKRSTKYGERIYTSSLTETDMQVLSNAVEHIRHLIETANEAWVDGKRKSLSELGDRVIEHAKTQAHGVLQKILKNNGPYNYLTVKMMTPIYFFDEYMGGPMREVYEGFRDAQDEWYRRVYQGQQMLAQAKKDYHYKDWKDESKHFHYDESLNRPAWDVDLSVEAMLQIYVTVKREINSGYESQHVLNGGIVLADDLRIRKKAIDILRDMKDKKGRQKLDALAAETDRTAETTRHSLTYDEIMEIANSLTDEQKAYADAVVKYMSTVCSEQGNEATMKLSGLRKFKEQYYFPFQSAKDYLYTRLGVSDDTRLKNAGFSKRRQYGAKTPLIVSGFTNVAAEHIQQMALYSTMTLPIDTLQRLINYHPVETDENGLPLLDAKGRQVKKADNLQTTLRNAYGKAAMQYINTFVTQVNGGIRNNDIDDAFNRLTGVFKRGAVMANLSVVAQQPTALMRAMALINPKYFLGMPTIHDYRDMVAHAPVAGIKEIGGFDTMTGKGAADWMIDEDTLGEKIQDVFGKGAEWADAVTWTNMWNAVKRETRAKYKNVEYGSEEFYEICNKRFRDICDYTQVYDSTLSKSELMRAPGGLSKMITAFMAEPTLSYNLLMMSGLKSNGKKINKVRALIAFMANIIVNSAFKSLVGAWRDDDEDKTYWEKWAARFTGDLVGTWKTSQGKPVFFLDGAWNPLTMIPWVKDLMSVLAGYDVERSDIAVPAETLEQISKLWIKYVDKGEDFDANDIYELAKILSLWTGYPIKRALQDVEGITRQIKASWRDKKNSNSWPNFRRALIEGLGLDEGRTKNAYDAVLNNDTEYIRRQTETDPATVNKYLERGYTPEQAQRQAEIDAETKWNNAVRDGLVANDERVLQAAQARLAGQTNSYEAAVKDLTEDGFSQQQVLMAVEQVMNALNPKAPEVNEPTEKKLYKTEDLKRALDNNDHAAFNKIRDALIKQGTSEDTIENAVKTKAKEIAQTTGTASMAAAMLEKYIGMDAYDAQQKAAYWAFQTKNAAQDWTEADYSAYVKAVPKAGGASAKESGISTAAYKKYREGLKTVSVDNDGDGKSDKKENVIRLIDSLPITPAQKDLLYYANNYAEKTKPNWTN